MQKHWLTEQDRVNVHKNARPETRSIRPEPGLLVLFPASFFQRTIPFIADSTRLGIVFDVGRG